MQRPRTSRKSKRPLQLKRVSDEESDEELKTLPVPTTLSACLRALARELCCSICLCQFNETVRTPCMHRFCRECLGTALKRRRVCPLCNKPMGTNRAIMSSRLFDDIVKVYETIREAYEEDHEGEALSQELRYDLKSEPNDHLAQLFPYPIKEEEEALLES